MKLATAGTLGARRLVRRFLFQQHQKSLSSVRTSKQKFDSTGQVSDLADISAYNLLRDDVSFLLYQQMPLGQFISEIRLEDFRSAVRERHLPNMPSLSLLAVGSSLASADGLPCDSWGPCEPWTWVPRKILQQETE